MDIKYQCDIVIKSEIQHIIHFMDFVDGINSADDVEKMMRDAGMDI
jgi:hypothetical protein